MVKSQKGLGFQAKWVFASTDGCRCFFFLIFRLHYVHSQIIKQVHTDFKQEVIHPCIMKKIAYRSMRQMKSLLKRRKKNKETPRLPGHNGSFFYFIFSFVSVQLQLVNPY
ncbi:hypothetical protein BBD42_27825 [Paenibacillus sp. BIHB 4019]|uniref:Uncharacterized protein n=1 Tax=Paenibacillus sp. BIHB 4019 TaxID=1870819 RepID=A0A1B2DQ90_9BACL|nr:hypothetical protein BBD42_27825 [Paenibacillus sp. BIHB 4019]